MRRQAAKPTSINNACWVTPKVKRSSACDTESEKHEPTRFFALKFDLCARSSIARMGNGKEGFRHGDPLLDNISQLAGSS